MRRIALLALFLLAVSLSGTALAAEQAEGTIEGQLVNGTAGGGSVADQEVTLKIFESGTETASNTSITDGEGRFVFNNLLTAPEYSYKVSLFYQEAEYTSDFVSFGGNQTIRSVEIPVWDSTKDAGAIKVATAHTIVYPRQGSLQVTEYYLFANDSDRTYIGSKIVDEEGKKETLNFSLPSGVDQFQPTLGLMECCIFGSEEGFVDTMAVMPGMKEVSYSYTVPTESEEYIMPLKIFYPIAGYDLLVQGKDVEVSADGLILEEPMQIENDQYSHLSGANLEPSILAIRLSGLPQPGDENTILWVILSVVVLAGGFGFYFSMKKRPAEPVSAGKSLRSRQQELLARLARLDDEFENGDIREEPYRSQRDSTKAQLLAIMKKADSGKGGG